MFIAQFLKGTQSSELKALSRLSDSITVKQFGTGQFVLGKPSAEDRELAEQGMQEARRAIASGDYRLVILDEINVAAHLGIVSVEDLVQLVEEKPEEVELVLTGRYADERLLEKADLVTEMREVKHYYAKGVSARKGIED